VGRTQRSAYRDNRPLEEAATEAAEMEAAATEAAATEAAEMAEEAAEMAAVTRLCTACTTVSGLRSVKALVGDIDVRLGHSQRRCFGETVSFPPTPSRTS
jgi:hypothetical protein